jgi:hypothetical protein
MMKTRPTIKSITLMMAAVQLTLGLSVAELRAGHGRQSELLPFEEAELFLELNATDGDLGLHFKADGEGWNRFIMINPQRQKLLDVHVGGNLGRVIGLTELFSESSEPSFDEVPPEDFLALFPPGNYWFFARTLDGSWLAGVVHLTHFLPGGVEVISPVEDQEVDPEADLTIEWLTLADPNPPDNVIEFYEVVVEKDEDDERLRVFSVHMLPTDTHVRVPAEFFEPGREYKVEIIAEETSGNRTAVEVPFVTAD